MRENSFGKESGKEYIYIVLIEYINRRAGHDSLDGYTSGLLIQGPWVMTTVHRRHVWIFSPETISSVICFIPLTQ